ncbi:hypothetical protein SAMN05421640_2357 [Ekhidna lutea]|uniref:Adhesin n=1 Tax=Ekhidna lutea TaxID=447679 RepID=A0A239K1A1_EKHLU|nr:hypothetical protein [Ekhidna lutea]SNT11805.1 hypothetical protein SAMN05421640_2357 [Ekhidna lutea]
MKTIYQLKYKLLTLCFLVSLAGLAKGQDEKKKYVEKNYKVSATTKLKIENKFGKVEINSWTKNEFDIKVEIIGKGRNEDRAQRILDAIEIDITENSSEIYFETEIDDINNKNEEGFEVNYTVYMPDGNPLEIKNSFGDVAMGDRDNDLTISVSYGSMRVGDVSGDASIKVSFGNGSVGRIKDGEATIKYSDFEIDGADKLDLKQGFSDIEIGDVMDLELESKYGKVEIEKAGKVDADAHFSGFDIEELTGSLELDCSYLGDFKIDKLAKSFTLIDIDGKFGSYEIGLEDGMNADINAEFSFSDLKYASDVDATFNYRVKESNKSIYKGKIGKGDSNKMIRIDSSYGNLKLKMD